MDEDGDVITDTVRDDVWVLATWDGSERIVCEFDSEESAKAAAEEGYVYDILNNYDRNIHLDRASAELELAGV